MDSSQWPQVVVRSMEEEEGRKPVVERKAKPGKDQILNCPRCNSSNIKFCYYNNYSLSQPRYFCKYCRRYWTAGGSLRNIPVGGTSRKNKRPSAKFSSPKNNKNNDGDDDEDRRHPILINGSSKSNINTPSSSSSNASTSCCWLSSDDMNQRELIPFMPMPAAAPPQPTSMCTTADEGGEARRLLSSSTVEDFKQLPSISSAYQNGGKWGDVPAFWNGNFGGGSW